MSDVWSPERILSIAIVFFTLVMAPLGAYADEEELVTVRSWEGSIRVKILNVRGGPGEGYDIVAKLKRGDKVTAVDQSGRWVRVTGFKAEGSAEGAPEIDAWVHRSLVNLPKNFMAPAFGDAENAFVDWAIERGDLSELSIESTQRLSLVLADETDKEKAAEIASEVGCAYRKQLKIAEPVTVTVWSAKGAAAGWIAQQTCP